METHNVSQHVPATDLHLLVETFGKINAHTTLFIPYLIMPLIFLHLGIIPLEN